MKHTKMLLCALLAAISLVFPSCGKDDASAPSAQVEIKGNVFAGTECVLPESYAVLWQAPPYYSEDGAKVSLLCADGNGEGHVVSFPVNDTSASYDDVPLDAEAKLLGALSAFADSSRAAWLAADENNNIVLHIVCPGSSPTVSSEIPDVAEAFADGGSAPCARDFGSVCLDADGNAYVSAGGTVCVFSPDGTVIGQASFPSWIASLVRDREGGVHAVWFDSGYRMSRVMPDGELTDEVAFGGGCTGCFLFGSDGLYAAKDDGLYIIEKSAGGAYGERLVLDYLNSGITDGAERTAAVYDKENVFVCRKTGAYTSSPYFYTRVDNADANLTASPIEIAYCTRLTADVTSLIGEFAAEHREYEIVFDDYTKYDTDMNPDAGRDRLYTDMLNGICTPDIVILGDADTYSEAYGIVESSLFTDLSALIDSDPQTRGDGVAGAVRDAYSYVGEDGEIGIWGLTSSFRVSTVAAGLDWLGEDGRFTISDVTGAARNTSEDFCVMCGLTRENAAERICGGKNLDAFIDAENASCSFDSPEFVEYLEFLKTLPASYDELSAMGAVASAARIGAYGYMASGQTAFAYVPEICSVLDWMWMRVLCGREKCEIVGFPSSDGESLNRVIPDETYVITPFCEDTAAAWELVKYLVLYYDVNTFGMISLPASGEGIAAVSEQTQGQRYTFTYDGNMWTTDPSDPIPTEAQTSPGESVVPDEEFMSEFASFLSSSAPIYTGIPDEAEEIISEELSAYLTGNRSAEECADKIQSRIGILLAERK